MPVEGWRRPAWAEVDLSALAHNTATLCRVVAPASLCAVVKADGYGHGARSVARTLLDAGATSLGVALVDEGIELRDDGIDAEILLLSEVPASALGDALDARLTLTVGSRRGARELAAASERRSAVPVHVKVDTGMHRQGVRPDDLGDVLGLLAAGDVPVGGVWTHFAVADGGDAGSLAYTRAQLDAFLQALGVAGDAIPSDAVLHAANTAGALSLPAARLDLVRVGLGVYGYLPHPGLKGALEDAGEQPLRPVMSVKARVVAVRDLPAGARPSYGHRRPLESASRVATVPVGYADGYPRAMLDGGAQVLIGGTRRPLAGVVTMDQLLVDCGDAGDVDVGDEVVLLGAQGAERIDADEWATVLETISWEVLCGIKQRIPKSTVT